MASKPIPKAAAQYLKAMAKRGGQARALALTAEERTDISRKGGLAGGPARNAALTPEQRSKIARKAAKARWKKKT